MNTKPIEIANQYIIFSLNFKPHSADFVTADSSGALRQWNAIDGMEAALSAMNGGGKLYAVVVSADGKWIVSSGSGNKVTVWNAATRGRAIEVTEHTTHIYTLDVSSDSTRFASGSSDNTARIFDIASGIRLIPPLHHAASVTGVKFSPDGSRIATATYRHPFVGIYDARSGSKLFEIPVAAQRMPSSPLSWSSDGERLFAASPGKITCLDTSTTSCSEWPIHNNGDRVSIVTSGTFITCSAGSSVSFWDSASHQQIGHLNNNDNDVRCISVSHDAKYLACGHDTGITVHSLENFLPQCYLYAAGLARLLLVPLIRVSATAFESWVQGNPTEAEAILSDEIAQSSKPNHNALVTRALFRTHLGEWRTALEDTEMSLQVKQSPIGQIARCIALVGVGEQEVALDELDLVFCKCDPSDIELLLVINSVLMFMWNKRKQSMSRLRRFIDCCDERMKDVCLQVLGMMYLKQDDYENAVQTLDSVKHAFTTEERGPLMSIFIIFNWNFENLKLIAWKRLCESLYVSGSVKELGDTLVKMVNPLHEDEREPAHGRILQEIITRSGEATLLAWTGKPSKCNSSLPCSPAVYSQTHITLPLLEGEQQQRRIDELRAIVPLADALMAYGSVTRSQPVRFAHFRLLLPSIIFRVESLRKEQGDVYRAETVGLGNVKFTTADSLPLKEPRKLVFVHPWIHHLRESPAIWGDEDDQRSDLQSNRHGGGSTESDADVELVNESMIEEVPTPPTSGTDVYTRALQLLAHLGQPFNALLFLKQADGAYKRVTADNEIAVRGIEDNVLRDVRVEVLEVL